MEIIDITIVFRNRVLHMAQNFGGRKLGQFMINPPKFNPPTMLSKLSCCAKQLIHQCFCTKINLGSSLPKNSNQLNQLLLRPIKVTVSPRAPRLTLQSLFHYLSSY